MTQPGPRVLVDSRDQIGESPVWSIPENSLYWVDVEDGRVQRWNASDHSVQRWNIGEAIGCIGLRKRGGLAGADSSSWIPPRERVPRSAIRKHTFRTTDSTTAK